MAVLKKIMGGGYVSEDSDKVEITSTHDVKTQIQKAKNTLLNMLRQAQLTGRRVGYAVGAIEPPAPKFTIFNDLPSEIRIKIWHYALPRRTLAMQFTCPTVSTPSSLTNQNFMWFERSWKAISLPATFFVCWESRVETLKAYELLFESFPTTIPRDRLVLRGVPALFNPDLDTLTFSGIYHVDHIPNGPGEREALELFDQNSITKVKFYRISMERIIHSWIYHSNPHYLWRQLMDLDLLPKAVQHLPKLSGLEKLEVLIEYQNTRWGVNAKTQLGDGVLLNYLYKVVHPEPGVHDQIDFGSATLGDVRAAILKVFKEEREKKDGLGGKAVVDVKFVLESGEKLANAV